MKAEIEYLGLKVQPLELSYEFYRNFRRNGKPATMVLGGGVSAKIEVNQKSMRFLEEMLSIDERCKNWDLPTPSDSECYKKIVVKVYDDNDYNIRTLELLDSYIANFKELFLAANNHFESNNYVRLEFKSPSQIINKGATKNVFGWWITNPFEIDEYKSPVQAVDNTDNFYINIKHNTNKKNFVPLGIPAFKGTSENKIIEFEIEISENNIDSFDIEILSDNSVIFNATNQDLKLQTTKGKHTFKWDGFNNDGVYDSTVFTTQKLKARIKGKLGGKEKTAETNEIPFEYKEVKWVDVKINKNTKRIDVKLRVNLTDGGAKGIKCYEKDIDPDPKFRVTTKVCPWDKIPKEDLMSNKSPIKTRTKSFKDLEKLALDGLNYHWGRNKNHFIAKNVDIDNEKYEVFVNAINTSENAMDDVSLIFNTNNKWMRSGNPGTVDDPISFIGNIVSREAICYNVGYIKSKIWRYRMAYYEDIEFKETSAHEIGHTILKAYGGTFYSYGHKGTVNTVTQSENDNATNYPTSGEIDIMPYYTDWLDYNQRKRMVASEKDVLSLLWLTKLELQ